LGIYLPSREGRTRFAVLDFDGKGHKNPLADPTAAALTVRAALEAAGLSCYLEKSRSGHGWHLWVFFSAMVPAELVRRVLLPLVPDGLPLRDGGVSRIRSNAGVELFPKQSDVSKTPARLGNQVFLFWWNGAEWPNNQFHRTNDAGTLEP